MTLRIPGVLTAVLAIAAPSLAAEKRAIPLDTHRFQFSPEIVTDPKDGTVRLAHSVLIADETGATDYRQTETLGDRIWARKEFLLTDKEEIRNPELFVFGNPKEIEVNGKRLAKMEPLVSTGWTRAQVPPEQLRKGLNQVVMRGSGRVLWEPGPRRGSGLSMKSTDGGQTWLRLLGRGNSQPGEYLLRLRLQKYAPSGWALSEVFDLWADPPGHIATPARCVAFHSLSRLRQTLPKGTHLYLSLRTGSTPTPDDEHWTRWEACTDGYEPDEKAVRHRWAQLKVEFYTSHPQASPSLPRRFEIAFDVEPDGTARTDKLLRVALTEHSPFAVGAVPFVYQEPSPRLKLLRERYQLDKVIAPGKTEMEQLMLLRHWVRNQWHTAWGSHPAAWMPPWDALIIFESKDQPDCLTMCTHYAAVFTQCCLALGWNARHCILDHHCVAEVWVDQHQKWVMMDAGNSAERADVNLHFERNGVPLSALELHLAHRSGKTGDITVCFTPARLMEQIALLCRPAPPPRGKASPRPDVIPLAGLPKYPVCQLNNYRRYAFPARNNYLTSLYPGELYQGWSEYFYDGYWWVGDSPDDPQVSPEYSHHLPPSRPQDIDWSLNWTRIHLCRTQTAGELQVDLETHTPNLARLEKVAGAADKAANDSWQPTAAAFVWKLKPGKNVLRARGVNQWGRAGTESRVEVEWTPS